MLDSVETEAEAVKLVQDVCQIHNKGTFKFQGWLSNSKEVHIRLYGRAKDSPEGLNKKMCRACVRENSWNVMEYE